MTSHRIADPLDRRAEPRTDSLRRFLPTLPDRWPRKWLVLAIASLLLILGLELFFSARLESQTFDEPAHLYSGYSYWMRSDFGINPEHPPLVKLVATLPLLVDRPKFPEPLDIYFRASSVVGGMQLLSAPGAQALLAHARAAVSIFVFLLALLVTLASYEIFGPNAALFALTLFVFDPLLLAHGPLLGTDMGAACCIFATVYAFYRYVQRSSLARLGICGLAAGLSLASKHSAVFVLPLLVLLAAVEVALREPRPSDPDAPPFPAPGRLRYALRLAGALAVIAVISVTILWACYGFRYQAKPAIIPPASLYVNSLHRPLESRLIAFSLRHHLLPEAYLFGLTDVAVLSRDGRPMYLFGRLYPQGHWYYFPAALLIKSTLGFLLLLALLPFARGLWRGPTRRAMLFFLIPPVAFLAAAMTSRLDIGIRHVLPIFPFLIVLAAAAAVSLARQARGWAWAVSLLLALHVFSSLRAFPNYLPYSNEFFGGVNHTHRFLSDSNVGWGGGLKALHSYLDQQHITQCWLAYSAPADPAAFHIPCKRLPTYFSLFLDSGQQQPVPMQIEGPVFISSGEVIGSFWGPADMNPYQEFDALRPAHVVAGEILQYDGAFPVRKLAALSHSVVSIGLLRRRQADQAVAQGQLAVALDPDARYTHEMLSYAYAANRQPAEALREYRTALHLFTTVHPEFAVNSFPPQNPLAPPHM